MIKEFKIPSPGESISEVELAVWMVEDGSYVEKNDELAEVESDKATLMLVAEESGTISIKVSAGQSVKVGEVAYTIDTSAAKTHDKTEISKAEGISQTDDQSTAETNIKITPVAAQIMKDNRLNVDDIIKGLRRITKTDVEAVISTREELSGKYVQKQTEPFSREKSNEKMSMLRRRLSERLVKVKNETAMLTTFNEIDMHNLIELRKSIQDKYIEKHGIKPGFMGFFTKAVSIAAMQYPAVNSQIENNEIVSFSYVDVGIAVQTPKGLMVPNIRNTESKSIPQIELEIKELAQKARDKKITIDDLSGGTISITNGGVFGSMLSTPLINPPQSAILGMHNIVERPVALNSQVVIRPVMYVALSYDHRVIDGKDSVGFLKTVKELIEQPEKMLFEGKKPSDILLDL